MRWPWRLSRAGWRAFAVSFFLSLRAGYEGEKAESIQDDLCLYWFRQDKEKDPSVSWAEFRREWQEMRDRE